MTNIESFRALVVEENTPAPTCSFRMITLKELPEEDTLIKIDYSTLNYKDALAITGKGKIIRKWPMVPGVDFSGTVINTSSELVHPGQKVILTGWSVGERYWGGYSQYQKVKAQWLVPLPSGMSTREAMMVGTGGFAGMQCVDSLERAGITPNDSPILVTGAAGGVGSVATAVLAHLGYQVHALTGNPRKGSYVLSLGATVLENHERWRQKPRSLESQEWAAAIDTVGDIVLARILAEAKYNAKIASVGLAGGPELNTTVMPFILRGVQLIGIDTVMLPIPERIRIWNRIATDLPAEKLIKIASKEVRLEDIVEASYDLLNGKIQGRVLVRVSSDQ